MDAELQKWVDEINEKQKKRLKKELLEMKIVMFGFFFICITPTILWILDKMIH